MEHQYNIKAPAVKRLMREAQELRNATYEFYAQPLEENLFEWHFTVRGPPDSDFDGGYYHGRIILPTEYPMKPPSIIMLTSNGRFEINKKICLSISGYHPESWQPSWSIRTALLAIIGFMPTEGLGAIGSLDYPSDERKALAIKSQKYCCPTCGPIKKLLKENISEGENEENKEDKELAKQICFKDTNNDSAKQGSENSELKEIQNEKKESIKSEETNLETSNVPDETVTNTDARSQGVRHRNVGHTEIHSQILNQNESSTNLQSSNRFSTYLIVIILLLLGLLLFRRIFLV